MIDKLKGENQARSVAAGGLRDFKEVVTNEAALREFREDPRMTVEEALKLSKIRLDKGKAMVEADRKGCSGTQ